MNAGSATQEFEKSWQRGTGEKTRGFNHLVARPSGDSRKVGGLCVTICDKSDPRQEDTSLVHLIHGRTIIQ
jgi:hypothetical protein